MAKLYYGNGDCTIEENHDVRGVEINYRGAVEVSKTSGDGTEIAVGKDKIIVFSLDGSNLTELFSYVGEIKIISVIVADSNAEQVPTTIKRVMDYSEMLNTNAEDMTTTSENLNAGYRHKQKVSATKVVSGSDLVTRDWELENEYICPPGMIWIGDDDDPAYVACTPELFQYSASTAQSYYYFNNVYIDGIIVAGMDTPMPDVQSPNIIWIGAFITTETFGEVCVGARRWDTSQCGTGICDVPVMGAAFAPDGTPYPWTEGYANDTNMWGEAPITEPHFKIFNPNTGTYLDAITAPATETVSVWVPATETVQGHFSYSDLPNYPNPNLPNWGSVPAPPWIHLSLPGMEWIAGFTNPDFHGLATIQEIVIKPGPNFFTINVVPYGTTGSVGNYSGDMPIETVLPSSQLDPLTGESVCLQPPQVFETLSSNGDLIIDPENNAQAMRGYPLFYDEPFENQNGVMVDRYAGWLPDPDNPLTHFSPGKPYILLASFNSTPAESYILTFQGVEIDPSHYPMVLEPGQNVVAYPLQTSMIASKALINVHATDGDIISGDDPNITEAVYSEYPQGIDCSTFWNGYFWESDWWTLGAEYYCAGSGIEYGLWHDTTVENGHPWVDYDNDGIPDACSFDLGDVGKAILHPGKAYMIQVAVGGVFHWGPDRINISPTKPGIEQFTEDPPEN